MKEYMDVFGKGKKENLVFVKGVSGGEGRGQSMRITCYVLYCGIPRPGPKGYGVEDLPGPVYKFLAKDTLYHSSSREDDAFADNKVHGWEVWVVEGGLLWWITTL